MTVDVFLSQMQKKQHSVGKSIWYSHALVGLRRHHPAKAPQTDAADKAKLYQQAFGRIPDCRAKGSDQSVTNKLRLGFLEGCNPLVRQPRSIEFAKAFCRTSISR